MRDLRTSFACLEPLPAVISVIHQTSRYMRAPDQGILPYTVPLLLLALLLAVGSREAAAQRTTAPNDVPEVTRSYAIQGATITVAPGQTIENGTIVFRDGVIVAVGSNLAIPADANVVEADSMFVYPAFIDGLSHVGITEPKNENQPRPPDPGNPEYARAGIQPDRSAADLIETDASALAKHREAGFAVANIVPYGRMLPGYSAVTSLTPAGPAYMNPSAGLYTKLQGARGVYPGTPVGVMAKLRQLFRVSAQHQEWAAAYEADPANLMHPPGDAVLEALQPVVKKEAPVLFHANSALEVQRAMRLQDDLGFDLVIAGAKQAPEMVSLLAESGLPIIYSVELPKEDKKKSDADSTTAPPSYNSAFKSNDEGDIEAERENLEARRAETRQRYMEGAAALEKAGVAFGFTGVDVKTADIVANVRKMVAAGLSEDAALAGLTINNARILGIDRSVGTLEPGKLANIVITTAPVFEKDSAIRHVFVNGHPTEVEAKKAKTGNGGEAGPEAEAFAGVWRFLVDSPDGPIPGRFELEVSGGSLEGTASSSASGDADLQDIEIDGDDISFTFQTPDWGEIRVTATRSDDRWNGQLNVQGVGDIPFTARRGPGGAR